MLVFSRANSVADWIELLYVYLHTCINRDGKLCCNNYHCCTHIAFVSEKNRRKHIFSAGIAVCAITSQCFFSRMTLESPKMVHLHPLLSDAHQWWNTIAIWTRIWIDRCCHVCGGRYELVNIWFGHSVCSNVLKPIIEPLINLNLLRLCYLDINMFDALRLICECHMDMRSVNSWCLTFWQIPFERNAHTYRTFEQPQMSVCVIILLPIYWDQAKVRQTKQRTIETHKQC